MNKLVGGVLGAVLLCMTGAAVAGTFTLPEKAPVLSITFPDTWKTEIDEEGALTGKTDDEEIEINLWALDAKGVEKDPKAALQAAAAEINAYIAEWVTDFKPDAPTESEHNGIQSVDIMGFAKDKEEGKDVLVSVSFFTPDNKTLFAMMFWGYEEGLKKYLTDIQTVADSIKKP